MEEPSVLDFVKALLTPWKGAPPPIPPAPAPDAVEPEESARVSEVEPVIKSEPRLEEAVEARPFIAAQSTPGPAIGIPIVQVLIFGLIAISLALVGQSLLARPESQVGFGVFLYGMAAVGVLIGLWRRVIVPAETPEIEVSEVNFKPRWVALGCGLVLAILAFALMGDDVFTKSNVALWLLGILGVAGAFWPVRRGGESWLVRFWRFVSRPQWKPAINRWTLLALALSALILFFRLYHLKQVPPEMVSDHAEKLLDIGDVLNGQTSIFFPRNTGREGFQMYLTAAVILLFHTGLSFLSLKIGTAIAGLVTLPFIYLLGKELGNRYVGLIAVAFAGVAYWPNVITRIALRFSLYPLFTAPALYFLVRGLRTTGKRDFILAGLFLGLGLHGYSPFRVVPILVVVTVGIYLLHRRSKDERNSAMFGLFIIVLVSTIVFLPLLRYALGHPEMFSYRAMTRLGSLEKPLDAPAWQIFLSNLWKALLMFGWKDGEVWVVSIPNRPALSLVPAVLFYLGVVVVAARYWRKRNWQDIFLLVSVPLLLMPSVLSLAFPNENPILNRTAGAFVPAFVIVGIALEAILAAIARAIDSPWGGRLAWIVGIGLFAWSARQDYHLVFVDYQQEYTLSAWNTSEMGGIIKDFAETIGTPDSAWVVGYPYWVDTRLVGMNAGFPSKDYAIWPDQFEDTLSIPDAKLFLINPEDTPSMDLLRQLYPLGTFKEYTSQVEGKNFWMFFVPSHDSSP